MHSVAPDRVTELHCHVACPCQGTAYSHIPAGETLSATWILVYKLCSSCRKRVEDLKAAFSKSGEGLSEEQSASTSINGRSVETLPQRRSEGRGLAKWALQGRVLLQRSWRQIKRDKATNIARVMSNVSSAIIFGSIYWRMGKKQIAVQNRLGLLQVIQHRRSTALKFPYLSLDGKLRLSLLCCLPLRTCPFRCPPKFIIDDRLKRSKPGSWFDYDLQKTEIVDQS